MDHDVPQDVGEATIERTADGLRPAGEGWFVVNVADLAARRNERMGITCSPKVAYADMPDDEPARLPWPPAEG